MTARYSQFSLVYMEDMPPAQFRFGASIVRQAIAMQSAERGQKKLIQSVGRNVERMIAVCSGFVFLCPDGLDAVLTLQSVLLADMRQNHHIITLSFLMPVNEHGRAMVGSSSEPAPHWL